MPSFRTGTVTALLVERPGLQRVEVTAERGPERAYVLTDLTGPVGVGDRVVMNTTAVELGLGTGGWHVVHWNLSRQAWERRGPGHIMKLRYTSLQVDTGSVEEHHPALLAEGERLDGCPVVACGLHSQLAVVAAVFASLAPGRRLTYVMTDAAALPLALSDLVADCRRAGLLHATITAGQAFGGDHEAVSLPSALAAARVVTGADAVVVAMGPGVVGTASRLGFSAVEVAAILDAGTALGGRAIACLRVSGVDLRERHRGVSHHSLTALRLARSGVELAVPVGDWEAPILDDLRHAGLLERHREVAVEVPSVGPLLEAAGVTVTTMGRGPDDDPAFFAAAAAAGVVAARAVGAAGALEYPPPE